MISASLAASPLVRFTPEELEYVGDGIRDGLAQIDTSAQQANHTARINATRKVTRYTRELLDFFEEEENS